MSTNRDLFKEAIAEAKAVKDMAIANAKAALEESFTPHLTKMLAAKLQEMEETEDKTETAVTETESVSEVEETEKVAETEETNEEINLDELLAELESESTEMEENVTLNEKAEETETEETETEEGEEESIKVEDMSEDDLKKFVEDVIKDMTAAGEIEAGHESEESETEEGEEESEEEEINLEEVLAELNLNEKVEEVKKEENKEVQEALKTIADLRSELNETNLLNAKLLYANKIFKAKNLSETQKVKVLNAFDKAKSVSESKVVYETLLESLKEKTPVKPINENLGSASKATGKIIDKKPILETNSVFLRMQKLAGL